MGTNPNPTPTILLALTDADHDRAALPIVRRLAQGLGARIVALHVVAPPKEGHLRIDDSLSLIDLAERRAAEDLASYTRALHDVPVQSVIRVGNHPEREVVAWLRENPADFVVIGTRQRRGLFGATSDPVAEAIRRDGGTPVVAVPRTAPSHTPRLAGAY